MFGRLLVLALALGLASLASGCFLDGTAFQAAGGGGGGAGEAAGGGGEGGATHGTTSAGGSGGAATSSTTTGTTSSTGSTSTTSSTTTGSTTSSTTTSTTTDQPCTYDFDCPDPEPLSICLEAACDNGVCTGKSAYEGTACGVAQECQGYPTCQSGQCKAEPLPFGDPLLDFDLKDCRKPICDGEGNAISVADDSQVPDSTECATKACENGVVKAEPKASATTCVFGTLKCCSGHCCDPFTCLGCVD